mmetsp:Transcript_13626/g.59444  ORF Transcript_13626/g.59444 Transcript_13626/m.59444 type:complete len:522 (+) Transcript_13626:3112-4677(+)
MIYCPFDCDMYVAGRITHPVNRCCTLLSVCFLCLFLMLNIHSRGQVFSRTSTSKHQMMISETLSIVAPRYSDARGILVDELNNDFSLGQWLKSSSSLLLISGNTTGHFYALSDWNIQLYNGTKLFGPLPLELGADCEDGISISLHTELEKGPRVNISESLFLLSPYGPERLSAYRYTAFENETYTKFGCETEHRIFNGQARCDFSKDQKIKNFNSSAVWLRRSYPDHSGECWSPTCTTIEDCFIARPPGRVNNSAVLTSLSHLPYRFDHYRHHIESLYLGTSGEATRTKIHIVGDSVASSIYSAMAFLLGDDWCTAEYRAHVISTYAQIDKDYTTLPTTASNSEIQLSYRFQVNFCIEAKVVNWSQERLASSMGLKGDSPVDFLLLQGGLWDIQDRNIADCFAVFPQILNAVLNFQPDIQIILVSPAPMRYLPKPSESGDGIENSLGYRTNRRLTEFRNMLQELSAQHGGNVHFYDTYMTLLPVSSFAEDRRHYPQHIMINVAVELYQILNDLVRRRLLMN